MLYHLIDLWSKWRGAAEGPWAYKDTLFRGTIAILVGFLIVWLAAPRGIRELLRRKIRDNP